MNIVAIIATVAVWFVGLVLDANIDLGEPMGFACLRVLFPVLTMGTFILRSIDRGDSR